MKKSLITIITPAYNAEQYILECIESVRQQSYAAVEHIVIDDGSMDRTVEIVEGCEGVTLVRQQNQGAPIARNAGLELATGSYVKFLDADDLLVEGALQAEVDLADGLSDQEIGYGYLEAFDSTGWRECRRYIFEESVQTVDLILKTILTSCTLYPIGALREVEGFDLRLCSRQEWNLNVRLSLAGYQFVQSDIFVYRHRFHESEARITNRKWIPDTEMLNLEYTREAFGETADPLLRDAWAARFWHTGRQFLELGDRAGAQMFFKRATEVTAGGHWRFMSRKYQFVAKWIGPFWAEAILSKMRSLSSKG
jgi:glycosyltransferase involved in cell wall biosynthesis